MKKIFFLTVFLFLNWNLGYSNKVYNFWGNQSKFKFIDEYAIDNFSTRENFLRPSDTLNDKKLVLLEENFKLFVLLLSKDNYIEAKKLISDKIINTVTFDVLKQIKQSIRINNKLRLDLFRNGIKVLEDGNSYPMLEYKYSDDLASPPKEYIEVLFDSSNKIIGLHPMKRD